VEIKMKGIFAEARSRRLPELGGVRRVIEGERYSQPDPAAVSIWGTYNGCKKSETFLIFSDLF
jgi:hypothetical protein